ncbi:DUF4347 domain-containing protein [Vreelandella titanicae]|uniref:Cadherin domain-containing protein n=5 Tax=Halomonadaceae TaxID=28256 RepID=A0AAP9NP18_9GAMM|nr:DUF4347 domain-containing protein [Halomonas titanicae]QKS25843.1 hypothetical protein FX987_03639 [Halomonas titanicae]
MVSDLLQRGNVKEVIFIDTGIDGWQTLVDGVPDGADIVTLDPSRDGLEQMAQWAQTHSGYDAIHIISHGSEGQIHLGNFSLDESVINTRASDLAQLGAALNEEGDLLLYGCSVASGEGQDFIAALAQATQADVAASDNLTGAASKGGDWVLEAVSSEGAIETQTFSAQDFQGALSTIAFDGAVQNGNFAVTVTEQGRTIEVTTTGATNYFSPIDAGGVGGSTGYIIGDTNAYGLTSVTFTFDVAVDVSSIQFVEIGDMAAGNYIFTSNDSQTASVAANSSTDIGGFHGITVSSLNFTNISSFTVTYSEGQFAPGFDNLVFEVASTNAAPTITGVPSDITVTEDTASNVDLSAVTFADADGDTLTATLTASAGTLAASSGGGVAVTGSGSSALTLSGSVANINTYLDTTSNIQYTGASNASGDNAATLTIKANDGTVDSSATTVNVDITAVDNAATFGFESGVTGLGTKTVTAVGTSATFTIESESANLLDSDNGGFTNVNLSGSESIDTGEWAPAETKLTFSIDSGKQFDLSSLMLQSWDGDNEVIVLTSDKGSIEFIASNTTVTTLDIENHINADFFKGITSFTLTENTVDGEYSGFYITFDDLVVTNITAVPTNAAPTITGAPSDITVTEDTVSNVDLSDVTLADSDGDNLTVTLTASAGTLAASSGGSVTVSGSGAGVLTLAGTAANINTYLDTTTNIQYTGASNASGDNAATLSIKANDGTVDSSTTTVNLDITAVNDAPTVAGAPSDITVTEDTASNVDLSSVTFADADGDSLTVTLTASAGTLAASSSGSVTVVGSGMGALSLSGSAADINAYLDTISAIQYTGAENASGDNAATLSLKANDGTVDSSTTAVNLDITAVNDAPTVAGAPSDITVTEHTASNVDLSSVTFADADGDSLTVTLTASAGTLAASSSGSVTVVGSGTGALTLSGSAADINAYLDTISAIQYTGAENASGDNAATLSLKANDGTVDSSTTAVNLDITAVNDAPTVAGAPSDITVTEHTASNVDLSSVTFADADGDSLTVTLTASAGTLAASSSGSVTVVGSGTGALTLSGSTADINAYLDTISAIQYTGAENASGDNAATFTISAEDVNGGSLAENVTVNLDITDVNDAPTYTGSGLNPMFTELDNAQIDWANLAMLFGNNTFDTIETGQEVTQVTLTVSNVSGTSDEVLAIRTGADSAIVMPLVNGQNGTVNTSELNFSYAVAVDDQKVATVVIDSSDIANVWNSYADNLFYAHLSDNPVAGDRIVTITGVKDNGGTENSGQDTTTGLNVSSTVTVKSVNDAPVLDASKAPELVSVLQNQGAPEAGSLDGSTLLSNIINSTGIGNYSDAEGDAPGLAITGVNENGALYYTTDGGQTWAELTGVVSDASALLLAANDDTRLYFKPDASYSGTLNGAISFRAWDGTGGHSNGDAGVATIGAGNVKAAFSTASDSVSITITEPNRAPTGSVTISGSAEEGQTLTASNTLADQDGLGIISYQWRRDDKAIDGVTGETYTLSQVDVGTKVSVQASYTDQRGKEESVTSSVTNVVTNVNDAPTGSVMIAGTVEENQTLTASSTLADEDGLSTISYQWLRDGSVIDNAVSNTYTLTQADVGSKISVRASYTDQQGTAEAVVSSATAAVANVNGVPTGSVTISGDAAEDQTLTASHTLADEDGLGAISYQWLRDGTEILGATDETYTLTQEDVGSEISVRASYTDQQGTEEFIASATTSPISAILEQDEDGVPDADEARVPSLDGNSTGDGNGDGIPDAEQSNISSVPFLSTSTAVSNPGDAAEAFITLSSNGSGTSGSGAGTLALRNVRQLDAPDDRPDDLNMPFGLIAFESDVETVGGSSVFSLFVGGDLDVNGYWKQDADGDWVNLASADFGGSLTREGNKIRFDFVIEDGGEFDSDGVANGIIVDPGAIGFRAPETSEEPVPTPEPTPDIDPDELPDEELNRAPVANNDEFSERFGWLLSGNLFEDNGNGIDKGADNDVILITGIGGQAVVFDTAMVLTSGATVTVQENGDFLYDQRAAFEPSDDKERFRDIFEYSIEDTHGAANTATVSVELAEIHDTVEISILHALYEVAFDRKADASGLDYWSDVRKEGVSVFDIAEFFLESEEFVSNHGNSLSDDDYLTMLYANAFDRAPDANGFEYWSDMLEESTVDHGDVMTHFAFSDEMQIKHLAEGFIFA